MDIGQAVVAALVAEGEAFVVDAELVQEGRVEVVDGDLVADDRVAEVVGFAVDQAGLEAAAGDQGGEAVGVVVAAVGIRDLAVLAEGGAAELAAPDDDRVVEQAALLEVE